MTTGSVVMWRKKLLIAFFIKMSSVFFLEFLNSACSVYQLLLSSEEGVTSRTDLDFHLTTDGAEFKLITAGTGGIDFMVFWMNIRFHYFASKIYSFPTRECGFTKKINYNAVSPFFNEKNAFIGS